MNSNQNYPKTKPLLRFQLISFVSGIVLLLMANAQLRIVSFVCALMVPVAFIGSLIAGIKVMFDGRKGWREYRSKEARRHYRIAGFAIFAPLVIFGLSVIISVISEYLQ